MNNLSKHGDLCYAWETYLLWAKVICYFKWGSGPLHAHGLGLIVQEQGCNACNMLTKWSHVTWIFCKKLCFLLGLGRMNSYGVLSCYLITNGPIKNFLGLAWTPFLLLLYWVPFICFINYVMMWACLDYEMNWTPSSYFAERYEKLGWLKYAGIEGFALRK